MVADVAADLTGGHDPRSAEPRKPRPPEYGDPDAPRLLMTVSDVTEARLAEKVRDDLMRDKAVLMQEIQHRVANSLQISNPPPGAALSGWRLMRMLRA